MTDNTNFIVFFSWQSDVPKNSELLRSFIKASIKKIVNEQNINVEYDEASRFVIGSQKVDEVILDKIKACDVFIADITPVSKIETNEGGKTSCKLLPNPNVAFELGYAMHCLSMEQVLIALPTETPHGQLPFDFNHNRLIEFDEQTNPMDEEIDRSLSFCLKTYTSLLDVVVCKPEDCILRPLYNQTRFIAKKNNSVDMGSAYASTRKLQDSISQFVNPFNQVNVPKVQVVHKEINHSYSPIELIIKNNNNVPIDNIEFHVTCTKDGISMVESNVKEPICLAQSLRVNRMYVDEESNTANKRIDTMNPNTTLFLEPFYIRVPYDCKSITLEWDISSRQGNFKGSIEMQVKAEVKDVSYIQNDAKIGEEYYSDCIEYE